MNNNRFIVFVCAAILMAATLVGCDKDPLPRIYADPTEINVDNQESSLTINIDATHEWEARIEPASATQWVGLSTYNGSGSQSVSLYVNACNNEPMVENPNRHAVVVFQLVAKEGKKQTATVHVTQRF